MEYDCFEIWINSSSLGKNAKATKEFEYGFRESMFCDAPTWARVKNRKFKTNHAR